MDEVQWMSEISCPEHWVNYSFIVVQKRMNTSKHKSMEHQLIISDDLPSVPERVEAPTPWSNVPWRWNTYRPFSFILTVLTKPFKSFLVLYLVFTHCCRLPLIRAFCHTSVEHIIGLQYSCCIYWSYNSSVICCFLLLWWAIDEWRWWALSLSLSGCLSSQQFRDKWEHRN